MTWKLKKNMSTKEVLGFPGGSTVKNLSAKFRRCGFDPWVWKIP